MSKDIALPPQPELKAEKETAVCLGKPVVEQLKVVMPVLMGIVAGQGIRRVAKKPVGCYRSPLAAEFRSGHSSLGAGLRCRTGWQMWVMEAAQGYHIRHLEQLIRRFRRRRSERFLDCR